MTKSSYSNCKENVGKQMRANVNG